ncbi:hypothetical protein COH54_06645 [Neisseria meningitidis]|nr:hypothetical protein COH54_06645 [Neisseria meningitidis]
MPEPSFPQLFVIPTNLHPVIPTKAGIQSVQFRSFPINSCCFSFLDSHFRGNDGGRVLVFSDKFLRH